MINIKHLTLDKPKKSSICITLTKLIITFKKERKKETKDKKETIENCMKVK